MPPVRSSVPNGVHLPPELFPLADLDLAAFFAEANLLTKPIVLSDFTRAQRKAVSDARKLKSVAIYLRDIAQGKTGYDLPHLEPEAAAWIREGESGKEVINSALYQIASEVEKSMVDVSAKYKEGWRQEDTGRVWDDGERLGDLLVEFCSWNNEEFWR